MPGRVIETNIGFCIQGKTLECGFQTVISDPVGSGAQAEVYRLAVVRRLMESPVFGLTHILPLNGGTSSLRNTAELRKMLTLTTAPENQLPTVIFTYHLSEPENRNPQTVLDLRLPSVSFPELARPGRTQESLFCAAVSQEKSPPTSTLPYNAGAFAEKRKGCCRVYLLDAALIQDLAAELHCKLRPGDAVLLEPACFGGGAQVFPYHPASREREKTIGLLSCAVYDYPRGKTWNFGSVQFLSAAREELLLKTSEMAKTTQAASDQWTQKFTQLDTAYKTEKAREYPLNWHLKVGNDPENLLRIYFFHDDKARKLVIGSLPEHLRAVQIR